MGLTDGKKSCSRRGCLQPQGGTNYCIFIRDDASRGVGVARGISTGREGGIAAAADAAVK